MSSSSGPRGLKKRASDNLSNVAFKLTPIKKVISPNGQFVRSAKILGKGGFKKVYKAMDLQSGREVAWSSVRLQELTDYQSESLLREVKIQKKMKHHNLMPLIDRWIDSGKEKAVIITPLATPLREYVEEWREHLQLGPVRRWVRQLLDALAYLHTHEPQVIHRDLKLDNVLLSPDGDVWLGDYGLARYAKDARSSNGATRYTKMVGTPSFMAPELFDEEGGYNHKVDVYAFGMTLLELLTGRAPYSKIVKNLLRLLKTIEAGTLPCELESVRSPLARNMIKWCLNKDPNLRPDTRDLMLHPFLLPVQEESVVKSLPVCYNILEIKCNHLMAEMATMSDKIIESCDDRDRGRMCQIIAGVNDKMLDLLQEAVLVADDAMKEDLLDDQVTKYSSLLNKKAAAALIEFKKDMKQGIEECTGERETLRTRRLHIGNTLTDQKHGSSAHLSEMVEIDKVKKSISTTVDDLVLDMYKKQCHSLELVMRKAVEKRLVKRRAEATREARRTALALAAEHLQTKWNVECKKILEDTILALGGVRRRGSSKVANAVDTGVVGSSKASTATNHTMVMADASSHAGPNVSPQARTRADTTVINQEHAIEDRSIANSSDVVVDDEGNGRGNTASTKVVDEQEKKKAIVDKSKPKKVRKVVGFAEPESPSPTDDIFNRPVDVDLHQRKSVRTKRDVAGTNVVASQSSSESDRRPPVHPASARTWSGVASENVSRPGMSDVTFKKPKKHQKAKKFSVKRSTSLPVARSSSWDEHDIADEHKSRSEETSQLMSTASSERADSPLVPLSPPRPSRTYTKTPSPMTKMLEHSVDQVAKTKHVLPHSRRVRNDDDLVLPAPVIRTGQMRPANAVKAKSTTGVMNTRIVDPRGRSSSTPVVVGNSRGKRNSPVVKGGRRTASDVTRSDVEKKKDAGVSKDILALMQENVEAAFRSKGP